MKHFDWCTPDECSQDVVRGVVVDELHVHSFDYLSLRAVVTPGEERPRFTVTVDGWCEVDEVKDLDRLLEEAGQARAWLRAQEADHE